ncbi:MAG: O-antigen ligase family protein [Candidatus Magasanikbacteria bacterium]
MLRLSSKENLSIEKLLHVAIKLFLFLLPWQTILILKEQYVNGFKWQYGTIGFYGTEILLWVIVFLFFGHYIRQKNFKFSRHERDPAMAGQFSKDRIFLMFCLLFLCYVFASTLWAGDRDVALQHALYVVEGFLLCIIILVGPFEKYELAKWFVYGSIIPSLLGIAQFLFQTTWQTKWLGLVFHPAWELGTSVIASDTIGRWLRAYGTFGHPNVFGGYLVLVIICTLFLAERLKDCKIKRLSVVVLYLLQITALFFTFSRSSWITFVIVLLFSCYIMFKKHVSFIIYHLSFTFILILLLTGIFFPLVKTRFSNQSVSEVRSTEERISGYGEAIQLFKQHPWVGVGSGNYTVAVLAQKPSTPGWQLQPVHNVFALFVVEYGLVGTMLLLGIVLSFIIYHVSRNTYQRDNKNLMCYVLCAMCYVLLAMFDHYLLSSYVGILLILAFFGVIYTVVPR